MEIFLTVGIVEKKTQRMGAQAVLPNLLTHPKQSSKHKMNVLHIFLETVLAEKRKACAVRTYTVLYYPSSQEVGE